MGVVKRIQKVSQKMGRDIFVQDYSLENEYCDFLIDIFTKYPKLLHKLNAQSGMYSSETEYEAINIDTNKLNDFTRFLTSRMRIAIQEYKHMYDIHGDLGSRFSIPELMCFRREVGQITPHVDSNGSDHARSLAIIWYLNDVEEGGLLRFPSGVSDITVSPKKGRLVIFPCDWTHHHHVTPVISNDRFSLMTFLEYK